MSLKGELMVESLDFLDGSIDSRENAIGLVIPEIIPYPCGIASVIGHHRLK